MVHNWLRLAQEPVDVIAFYDLRRPGHYLSMVFGRARQTLCDANEADESEKKSESTVDKGVGATSTEEFSEDKAEAALKQIEAASGELTCIMEEAEFEEEPETKTNKAEFGAADKDFGAKKKLAFEEDDINNWKSDDTNEKEEMDVFVKQSLLLGNHICSSFLLKLNSKSVPFLSKLSSKSDIASRSY